MATLGLASRKRHATVLCSEYQLVKHHSAGDEILPLPCNRWSCDYCGPRRRHALIRQAAAGQPNKVLTITVNTAVGQSPLERRQMLHNAWKILTKRIMRQFKWKKLHYMAFVEKTKRGEPHLHILLRCEYIPQQWLSSQLKELIGSPIVWIEQIKNTGQAVHYVTKYVGKEPAQFGTLKRYWMSRDYELEKTEVERQPVFDRNTMVIQRERYRELAHARYSQGWTSETTEDGWQRWYRPGQRSWERLANDAREAAALARDGPAQPLMGASAPVAAGRFAPSPSAER